MGPGSSTGIGSLTVLRLVVGFALALVAGCTPSREPTRDVVLWISIDGLRPDYVAPNDAPFLHALLEKAPHTRELSPPFPSLTLPSHATQSTGVGVSRHGITGNSFWDAAAQKRFEFPDDSSLVQAEPIWVTATRQGRRAAVLGWPLSYKQQGQNRAAIFDDRFEKELADVRRLDRVLDAWRADRESPALALLLSYVIGPDAAGHRFGPASAEVKSQMRETDAQLAEFFEKARATFADKAAAGDRLHVLFTTDHGMAPVRAVADFEALVGTPLPPEVHVERGSTLAHVFLDHVAPDRRTALEHEILEAVRASAVAVAYRRSEIPARWEFAHPDRVGDVVIALRSGVVFGKDLARPVATPDEVGGVRGMHGYDPDESPDMLGLGIFWSSSGGAAIDLGRVDARRLHPTVARLLGIEPSPLATAKPLDLPALAR